MADCSKAIEFSLEFFRLCDTEKDRHGACVDTCPFYNDGEHTCPFHRGLTQEDVDIVQKWSDEHPAPKPKTYADDFFEKFPAANRVEERPAFCRARLYGTTCQKFNGNVVGCFSCWNEPLPD